MIISMNKITAQNQNLENQILTDLTYKPIGPKTTKEPWFDCGHTLMRIYIYPQNCCNYPKLTIKYITDQACRSFCTNWDCVLFCYNNVFKFYDNGKVVHQNVAKLFKNHFIRHKNDSMEYWMKVIDSAVTYCGSVITNNTYNNKFEILFTCIYFYLYLNCPQYEDYYVCKIIDEYIKEPRNCYNQTILYHSMDIWYMMDLETRERIMKEEHDCDEYFRILPHPYECTKYPVNIYLFLPKNECEIECTGNEDFDFCYYSCINQKFNLVSNMTSNFNNFWTFFAGNFNPVTEEEKKKWQNVLVLSLRNCIHHFSYDLLRGRKKEEPMIVSQIIECIFQQNFLSYPINETNYLCPLLKNFVSNPTFCHHTDLKLFPAKFWRLDRDIRAEANAKN
ncbi:hypothetical protein PVAND_016969 [Polypedilum vanderplanki]|uniref:Uncharacterized protein n=1 Tax=Polypedilum vanderplanki TaxID=319348 RepID=A0A9J6BGY2_POLVA|nr:hypothetical protein PVAND_016969 [Polypedilum vanderplanki]